MKSTRFPSNETFSPDSSSYFDDTEPGSAYLDQALLMSGNTLELRSECFSEDYSSFTTDPEYFYINRRQDQAPKMVQPQRPRSKYFIDNKSVRIDDSYSSLPPYENSYVEITRAQLQDGNYYSPDYLVPKKWQDVARTQARMEGMQPRPHMGYLQSQPSTSTSSNSTNFVNFNRKLNMSPDECYYTDDEPTKFMNMTEITKIYENIEELKPNKVDGPKIGMEGPYLYGQLTILVFNEAYCNSKSRKHITKTQNSINRLLNVDFTILLEHISDEMFSKKCTIYGMHITNQLQLAQSANPDVYVKLTKELHKILTQLKNSGGQKSIFRKICDKIKKCF